MLHITVAYREIEATQVGRLQPALADVGYLLQRGQ